MMKREMYMDKATYRNNYNEHKYIDVVHYSDGHYYVVQYMQHGAVISYMGTARSKFRVRKGVLSDLLQDYIKL